MRSSGLTGWTLLAAVGLAVGGCGGTTAAVQADEPSASASPAPSAARAQEEIADIYSTVLGPYAGSGRSLVYLMDRPDTSKGTRLRIRDPRGEPFNLATREAMKERLGPSLRWIRSWDEVPGVDDHYVEDGNIVVLGPIQGGGDEVRVAVNTFCSGTCSSGEIHLLTRRDDHWVVSRYGYECQEEACPGGWVS